MAVTIPVLPAAGPSLYDRIDPFVVPAPFAPDEPEELAALRHRISQRLAPLLLEAQLVPVRLVPWISTGYVQWWILLGLALLLFGGFFALLPLVIVGGLGMLSGFAASGAGDGALAARRSAARSQLDAWALYYRKYYFRLATSDLPLLIAGEEMWQDIFHNSLPALVRPVLSVPQRWEDRLFYACALWDALEDYHVGKRGNGLPHLAAAPLRLAQLKRQDAAVDVWLGVEDLARFAAVHDFFYGPQREFDTADPASTNSYPTIS